MKALVTGGAGFIGSHLVDLLLAHGHSVVAMDSLVEGRMENLSHLKRNKRFKFVKADLRNQRATGKVVAGNDAIFHMAAQANIRKSLSDHRADLENNLLGTVNILEAMKVHKVKELIFASTSAVYGEATIRPTPESYAPLQTSLYGASKLSCEAFAEAFTEFTDMKFWAFRFSNVVGERLRRGVIWDFVHKLLKNPRELEVLGDGGQIREYIDIRDCLSGIMAGYTKLDKRTNIFNLAVEDNKTVDEVADIVTEVMGLKKVTRKYTGGKRGWIGDNPILHLDITKLKGCGWSPRATADEAIEGATKWSVHNP